jgi:hypothetical protein
MFGHGAERRGYTVKGTMLLVGVRSRRKGNMDERGVRYVCVSGVNAGTIEQ